MHRELLERWYSVPRPWGYVLKNPAAMASAEERVDNPCPLSCSSAQGKHCAWHEQCDGGRGGEEAISPLPSFENANPVNFSYKPSYPLSPSLYQTLLPSVSGFAAVVCQSPKPSCILLVRRPLQAQVPERSSEHEGACVSGVQSGVASWVLEQTRYGRTIYFLQEGRCAAV